MPDFIDRLLAKDRATAGTQDVHDVRGFHVVVENPYANIDTPFVLRRFESALALIERYQPIRYRHLRRDVPQFWIARYPTRGVYFRDHRTILTEITFLSRAAVHPDAEVASSILHEGVHARIAEMGRRFGFHWQWASADEERICRRAESVFGHALPPGEGGVVLARVEPLLDASVDAESLAPTIDWRQARLNTLAVDMEDARVPQWLRAPLMKLARWRLGGSGKEE